MKEEVENSSKEEEKLDEENFIQEKNNKDHSKTKSNIQSKEDKIKDLEDKLARALAEMENQRRRFEKEKEDAFDFGGFVFARESLALIDNLDRAKIFISSDENFKNNKDLPKILENFEIIQKDLISIFKKNGIEQISCLNRKFDPNFHQAMLEIEDENKEPGTIVQEIQKGFTMKERLLRPSLVGITKIKLHQNDKENQKHKENERKNDDKN